MGPQLSFLNNPRYQRALQIYSRFDPSRKAIIDTVIADEHFADEEMRNKLRLLKMGHARERGEKGLKLKKKHIDLAEKALETEMDISGRRLDLGHSYNRYLKDQAQQAELLGYGNIGLSGLRGYIELRDKMKEAARLKKRAGLYG